MKKTNLKVLDANVGALLERQKRMPSGIVNMNSQRPPAAAFEEQINRVVSSLDEFSGKVKACQESQTELQARLQDTEQKLAGGRYQGAEEEARNFGADVVEALQDSDSFASLKDWNQGTARAKVTSSIRAILTEGHGDSNSYHMPANPERGGITGPVLRPLTLLQALPSRPTSKDSVQHVRLGVIGDVDQQDSQGDEKAEVDFDGTLITAPIVTIAGHTTASRQILSDEPALQQQINGVITHKLLAKLEDQILNSTGTGNIDGLVSLATLLVPTMASTPADRIGEAVTLMQSAGYTPSVIVMNPLDWFAIAITKTETEGEYIFGSPIAQVPQVLWRIPVVLTPSLSQGISLVIDTSFVTVLDRELPGILISNSHKDYFTRNLIAILGELRAGLEVRDTGAVSYVQLNPSE